MKNKLEKALSFVLVTIILCSAIPFGGLTVFAAEETYSGTCGDNLTWKFNDSTGELKITGSGAMDDYSPDNRPWESYVNTIKTVTIGDSVTTIGKFAFLCCSSIKCVTIGNSITSIGYMAFRYCGNLISITIPDSITSIGESAFEHCSSLTSITIPDSVTNIEEYAFSNTAYYNDTNNWENDVLYIDNHLIDAKDTIKDSYEVKEGTLTIADQAIDHCPCLTSITIPDSVTNIGNYAFWDCKDLASVIIGNGVTSISDSVFSGCGSLTSVTIPDSVITIGDDAFSWCDSLTNITIPESVTNIGSYAFAGCGLTSVAIGDSVKTISDHAFYSCDSLADIYYSGTHEQWDNISIGSYNDPLLNATIHFLGEVAVPIFEVYQVSKNGDILTVNIDLTENTFNSLDLAFEMEGLKCTEIEPGDALLRLSPYEYSYNPDAAEPYSNLSVAALDGVTLGTLITVTLEIIDEEYSFTAKATSCVVSDDNSNDITVQPIINGVVFGKNNEEPEKYTITYDANGGSNAPASQTKTVGVDLVLSDSTPNRSGYNFLGWSTDKNATVAQYLPGSIFSTDADITLYAVWKSNNIYNLGEETYSFDNFSDSYSNGHCFGMSITSSGYYTENLDRSIIGLSNYNLYGQGYSETIKKPICHYQHIQGNFTRRALVAGSITYYHDGKTSAQCWNEVLNYVKSHEYDHKGNLQIQIWKSDTNGHAVNFLYYKNENGQDRLYAYDNNFPNTEVYFYLGSDGKIYEAPKSTYGNSYTETICLVDMNRYFEVAQDYKPDDYAYAENGEVDIESAKAFPMACSDTMEGMLMYELPENSNKIIITPKVDNATFEYMEQTYSFGDIDEDTYGILTLSDSENIDGANFIIKNEPDSGKVNSVSIGDISMNYKDSTTVTPNISADEGVEYTVTYSSSEPSVATVDENGNVYASGKGDATITCTVTDEYGNVVTDTCDVEVKYSFGQWLIIILLFGWIWYI